MDGTQIFAAIMFLGMIAAVLHGAMIAFLETLQDRAKFSHHWTVYPSELYKYTKMNIVGCIICWFVILIFAPVCALGGLIRRLFTIGRKTKAE